jgi:flagellar biosynthesis/type III secretory pathway chaperone
MTGMAANLQELIDVLKVQIRLTGEMTRCLAAEREAVIAGDTESLNREVAEKERLVKKIQEAEARRQRNVDAVSEILNITDSALTLETLAAASEPPWSERLAACRNELRSEIKQAQAANQSNQELITQSLALVQGSLDMLGNTSAGKGTYGMGGEVVAPPKPGRLLKGSV